MFRSLAPKLRLPKDFWSVEPMKTVAQEASAYGADKWPYTWFLVNHFGTINLASVKLDHSTDEKEWRLRDL